MAGAKPSTPSVAHVFCTSHTLSAYSNSSVSFYAQISCSIMSSFRHDAGCYILSSDTYRQFLHYTHLRYHLIEELYLLLVQTGVELHHILRLIEDSLPAFYQHGDKDPLHRSFTALLQDFRALRRHYYTNMMEQNSCPELQSI